MRDLRAVFGNTIGGYVGVTKAKAALFQQTEMPNPNNPDEATAAITDARFLTVHEAGSNMTNQGATPLPMNATIVRTFTDVAGTLLPFQRKFGVQENMEVTWGMAHLWPRRVGRKEFR